MNDTRSYVHSLFPRSFGLILITICLSWAAFTQSALDGFDPNANGIVRVIVVQPDGKIIIGGGFTSILGVTRNHIARLNPDGTLDTVFNPNANNDVLAIALQDDGKIIVGGIFAETNSIGGQTRNYIARLDPATGLADSFDPNAKNGVSAIAVQADGKILVGGGFFGTNSIGGQTRNRIARLDPVTGLADSFNPNSNSFVQSIAVQPDGKILVGGDFRGANSIGGQTRNYIARLDATTGLADSFDPNANHNVLAIAVQVDGKILVGGDFFGANCIGGQTRNRIARLDAATGLADSFDPNANNSVNSIGLQADGKILAGGSFGSVGGETRNYIARLDATTGLADSFDPNANSGVYAVAVQADKKILVGGLLTSLSPNGGAAVLRNRIARLENDGRLDQTLDLGISCCFIYATAVQPDGKILIGGQFDTVLGVARKNIARLNPDGTLDMAFDPNANNTVLSISLQADGKIIVGGEFSQDHGAVTIGGQTRNHLARLDGVTGAADSWNPNASGQIIAIAVQADGKVLVGGFIAGVGGQLRNYIARLDPVTGSADSWDPNANRSVLSIVVQADGKILVGGVFGQEYGALTIGGQTRNHIARLDPDTGLADSFDPNLSGNVNSLAVQADGKILAAGAFNSVGGQIRHRIARIDPLTGEPDSWDPNANSDVKSIAVQADGKIVVGGIFTQAFGTPTIGGQTRSGIARLDPDTGFADTFDPQATGGVFSVAMQADGKILAGGQFSSIGGLTRSRFARLTNDIAAQQNLNVTQPAVSWTLGGSNPLFESVTFEYSDDTLTYSPLGSGTLVGSTWTLMGLDLPVGQNLYIRARGNYRGGDFDSSNSIIETVRNVYFDGQTPTPSNTPTATPTATPTCDGFSFGQVYIGGVEIPDNSTTGVSRTITVSGLPVITDLNFRFDGNVSSADPNATQVGVNHSRIGDLVFKLTSPAGTSVTFFDRPGFTGTGFGCDSNNLFQLTLDDQASLPVGDQCGENTDAGPLTGTFSPNNPLAAFNGQSPNGIWTITAIDNASGETGSLRAWTVIINSSCTSPTSTPTNTPTATPTNTPTTTPTPTNSAAFDYDGDSKSDVSIFRPTDGAWYLQQSTAGLYGTLFGYGTDKITPADFDGDGKTDIAVYRPDAGIWYVFKSSNGTVTYNIFGLAEDLPTPADYDGDGKADVSVFRPSTATWYRQNSSDGSFYGQQFGLPEDKPTVGDFDGDGKADIAIFRPSLGDWYQFNSSDGSVSGARFGFGTDVIVPADYDGDGETDIAIFRPSTGIWYITNSSNGTVSYNIFGLPDDIPAPGDFDGDGKADVSVFRPSDGTWYRRNSSDGSYTAFQFGASGDKPTQASFIY